MKDQCKAAVAKALGKAKLSQQEAIDIVNRIKDARETGALLSPAELSAITKFLKDNGIECTKDDMEKATGALHVLPGPNFEDIEEREAFM